MIATPQTALQPRTLAEFQVWESQDGFKYEWNDGELIQFTGMNKTQLYIYDTLNKLFIAKGYWQKGALVTEQDVILSGIQLKRPDIAFFTNEQIQLAKSGEDEIPEFVVEVISGTDNINHVEKKVTEYFNAGVKIVWNIFPELQLIYVYSSRKNVKICSDIDVCSAEPILPDFKISVNEIFA